MLFRSAAFPVPLYWLARALPIGAVDTVLLENHVLTALATALLYLLVRRLGYRPVGTLIDLSRSGLYPTNARQAHRELAAQSPARAEGPHFPAVHLHQAPHLYI